MDAWQHRQFIGRLMDKKNKHDRWHGEGKFAMPVWKEEMVDKEAKEFLGLESTSMAFVSVISGVAIQVAQVKQGLDIERRALTIPPIMGDWLPPEAANYIASHIPKLQEHLGAIAKGTNEGDLDGAVRALAKLFIATIWPLYNLGYIGDLELEQQSRELAKEWEEDKPEPVRIGVHYDVIPHNPCNDPIQCDCECPGCIEAKIKHYGMWPLNDNHHNHHFVAKGIDNINGPEGLVS